MASKGAKKTIETLKRELSFRKSIFDGMSPQKKAFAGELIEALEWAIKRLEANEIQRLETEVQVLQIRLEELRKNHEA